MVLRHGACDAYLPVNRGNVTLNLVCTETPPNLGVTFLSKGTLHVSVSVETPTPAWEIAVRESFFGYATPTIVMEESYMLFTPSQVRVHSGVNKCFQLP
jgi:hypothetical protein